jgi:hypothetical protein
MILAISRVTSDVKAPGLLELVKSGFTRKSPSITRMPNPKALESMVAEAAYYRAGRRGFSDGNDLYDWLEAEKEILARFDEFGVPWKVSCTTPTRYSKMLSTFKPT